MHSRTPYAFQEGLSWPMEMLTQQADLLLTSISRFEISQAQAITDFLTGVYNRRFFTETLKRTHALANRHNFTYSVVLLDVDNFKELNDTAGHAVGDGALLQIARVLKKHLRSSDTLGRIGGDEFAVILPQTPLNAAGQVAEKLRRAVKDFFSPESNYPKATISAGVAGYIPAHERLDGPEAVIASADKVLYLAKKSGRNMVRIADPILKVDLPVPQVPVS